MTQQMTILRELWRNQPLDGYRFRATIQADPYSRDEGRAMWILANPTLARSRTVLASHMWATQDQSGPYPPPVGATISFDARVRPYRRTNGDPGFGLINICNVIIEAESGGYAGQFDSATDDITVDEFAEAVAAPLAAAFEEALMRLGNDELGQNIAAEVQRRTEKLTLRLAYNARLATLAQQLEEVRQQFFQVWQRAQASTADFAQLEAELAADPDFEEERLNLQQLATRQRDLVAASSWQLPPPAQAASASSADRAIPGAADTTPLIVEAAVTDPQAPVTVAEAAPAPAEADEAPQFDILEAIKAELDARYPNVAPAIRVTPPRQKGGRQKATPQAKLEPAKLEPATSTEPAAPGEDEPPALVITPPPILGAVDQWNEENELAAQPAPELSPASPSTERARDVYARNMQIVDDVWHLVQQKQPRSGHHAAYTLAQIKDGRRRETDHLKLLGLKAILELLTLVGERPTRKELGNRYLGYDLPKGWSLAKLIQEKLPLEDEHVREEIVNEIKADLHPGLCENLLAT